MADLLTLQELGLNIEKMKMCYIGDGNNMTNSFIEAAGKLGFELAIATPKGYEPSSAVLEMAQSWAKQSGAKINLSNEPKEAIKNADVVVTDTWISMGQEDEKEGRIADFKGFCIDSKLMAMSGKKSVFLHCLPAYRGYEMSEEVFESHADEIFAEAENRLHAQKGIMVWCDQNR